MSPWAQDQEDIPPTLDQWDPYGEDRETCTQVIQMRPWPWTDFIQANTWTWDLLRGRCILTGARVTSWCRITPAMAMLAIDRVTLVAMFHLRTWALVDIKWWTNEWCHLCQAEYWRDFLKGYFKIDQNSTQCTSLIFYPNSRDASNNHSSKAKLRKYLLSPNETSKSHKSINWSTF